ncbi:MAG: 5-formyltetrahydrofolate cyclo-ligase [Anaerohalosphaera sp.]|nr:5-formyltetrahydrofolate cyclo-ligase [Anaerohalosphaera sp.]
MDKQQLRKEVKDRIGRLTDTVRAAKSKKACKYLIETPQFQKASVVMVYLSMPYEVDTTSIILQAWQQEKVVAVPKVSWQQRHMIPVQINSLESGLSTEEYGLRNPTTGLPVPIEEIDIIVTPGLAFDKHGGRLGRGGSYYDRFFASELLRAQKYGLLFDEQVVESVPMTEHDKPVDVIVTDQGITNCK